ncbi:F-box/kelch-repeat protein At3g23880-like [Salvia miltiorrhiza]|uniref:F-box/kelch-repeat protein At3g23880-like n=1 Tax=Salvia miltiorrhiza TaxID=226208 RepID=UPI0025AC17A4|nr:F-box/kelch-repeat protein At3g23880-like [Salvia miltiorrhiza]
METRNIHQSLHLHEEMIFPSLLKEITEEILSRLPVKSLLRFRCVSKAWRSLIDSKRFIKMHYQNSTRNPSLARHKVLLLKSIATLDLELTLVQRSNPSTRISKKLPHLDDLDDTDDYGDNRAFDSCGLGWDESSGDYKVFATATVMAGFRHTMAIAMMYSLKRDSWKEVKGWDSWKKTNGIGIGRATMRMGMLASGSLHWERCDRRGVVAFDLKREVIGAVELPECSEGCRWLGIGVIGECLSAYYRREYSSCVEIWMKKESWEKVVVLDQLCNPLHISPALAPFWGGGFLLIKIGNLMVFDRKGIRVMVSVFLMFTLKV